MPSVVYLNGEFIPLEQAKISVLDRGFLFGDGVYEVIPVYQGKIFRLPEHLERLGRSLQATDISLDKSEQSWAELFAQVMVNNDLQKKDASIYVQVTRGVSEKRDHTYPEGMQPTVFVMANPVVYGTELDTVTGIRAITLPDNRWTSCYIKSICLLPNVLLRQQATDQGVEDVILIRDGYVTEAAAANVFIVKNGVLYTPPKDNLILGGITRDLIVELSEQQHFDCHEQAISEQQLKEADEVWVTSSTREIVPVVELNGNVVGDGKVGPMWYTVSQHFQTYKSRLLGKQ